ncbi:ATP-binding protein [Zoogloea sp.]|uniref:ATP-binding protein n=1 Tax=Zoogloea sp. TaxID=49181 RepID=UPI0035AEE4ED
MRRPGLNRHLMLSLSGMALGVMLLLHVGFYVFYALVTRYNPALVSPNLDSWPPTPSEWVLIAVLTILGLYLAIYTATRLSNRILQPLNAVAEGVRRVASGDLAARATRPIGSVGETATLVDDFNSMAERLERTNRELVIWNAAIAHELRTPVTILRGRLQGLAEGVFEPDEALFRRLLSQVEDLSRLIDDLRTLSLADSGHLALQQNTIDLSTEICHVVELLDPELRVAGLDVRLELHPSPLLCDPARMRQVLLALLDNARRHALPGPLWIHTRQEAEHLILSIEDSGPGIAAEMANHIFEAFVRGDPSRSRPHGGTGLGLAVVRAIIEAHRGWIHYQAGQHGGSCFVIRLPRLAPTHHV